MKDFAFFRIWHFTSSQLLAYKYPETLEIKGLSGALCFDEKTFVRLGVKIKKGIIADV